MTWSRSNVPQCELTEGHKSSDEPHAVALSCVPVPKINCALGILGRLRLWQRERGAPCLRGLNTHDLLPSSGRCSGNEGDMLVR